MDIPTDILNHSINKIINKFINNFIKHSRLYIGDSEDPHNPEYILIQYWTASSRKNCEGYRHLTTRDQAFNLVWDHQKYEPTDITKTRERIISYRHQAVAHIYNIQEEEGKELLGVIGRVFRSKRMEISPNISHYSKHEYPLINYALSCGIRASFCLPLFLTDPFSGEPDGVVEFLFSSDRLFHGLKWLIYEEYCSDDSGASATLTVSQRIYACRRYTGFLNVKVPPDAAKEIHHLLMAVQGTYNLPVAQCWVVLADMSVPSLLIDRASSEESKYSKQWCRFREACSMFDQFTGDDLVTKTYLSRKSFFCRDITGLSITHYPLVHYIRDCGSVACITIYLHSKIYKDCVLEFFVPYKEIDINYPQIFLNSLFAIVKKQLQTYTVLGEEILVEVTNSSMQSETKYLKIGHPATSLPHHEGSEDERDGVPQLSPSWQFMVEDGEQHNQNVQDIDENCSTIRENSRTHNNSTAEIIYEQSLIEDVGDAMNTKSQSTKKLLPQVQGTNSEEETMMLDPPNQQPMLQDSTQNKTIIVDVEKDSTSFHFVNTTCIEGMPKKGNKSEKDISYESLSEHFGTQLNDAAKSFGVSRSTLKRICRGYGIKRWQSGKRGVGDKMSSKVRRINSEETSRKNFSTSVMLPEQDTPIVAHTQQDMKKMTVKATYEGVNIMFDLLNSSGMTDLEDNVIERLHLERKKFNMKFQDEDGDWILIACDKDVRSCMKISRSLKKTTITMLIDRPLLDCAP